MKLFHVCFINFASRLCLHLNPARIQPSGSIGIEAPYLCRCPHPIAGVLAGEVKQPLIPASSLKPQSTTKMKSTIVPSKIVSLTCAVICCFVSASTAQTLLVHYDLEEGTGSTATDSGTGTDSNGTLGGNATWSTNTPSGDGSSLSLSKNGTDSNFVSASSSEVDALSSFTITLWLNIQGNINVGDRLVSTLSSETFKGFDFNIQALTSGSSDISASGFRLGLLVDGVSGGSALVSSAGTSVNADSQWAFLAVTYDGTRTSNNVAFYTGTTTATVSQLGLVDSLNMGTVDSTTGNLQIGNTSATTSDRTPSALFDDVRIYSGAASSAFLEDVRVDNLASIPEPATSTMILGSFILALAAIKFRRRNI